MLVVQMAVLVRIPLLLVVAVLLAVVVVMLSITTTVTVCPRHLVGVLGVAQQAKG